MNSVDRLLNDMTMYRLVVYGLCIIASLGIAFSLFGRMPSSPTAMVASLVILLAATYLTDRGLARWFHVPSNQESWLITALILFLIIQPAHSLATVLALALAGAIASASKFLLFFRGRHIFNPAALAAAFMSVWGLLPTTWWVGSSWLWPFTLIAGLAVVRKTRRFPLFLAFVIVSIVLQAVLFLHAHQPLGYNLHEALLASPLIFLSTIMLTEPATMPPRRNQQIVFAALVAALYVSGWKLGPLVIYPETALLIGNLFAYFMSPKFSVRLRLAAIQPVSGRVYNYIFQPDRPFNFLPGQYMEWTLSGVPYDSRGNRRTFTIASSPTEPTVQVGLKYYEPASTYKAAFNQLRPGDMVYGSQLAGNFTLKGSETKKLAFVAGGIGITPFRSMVKYLTDKKLESDIVLLYMVSEPDEFAYAKELKEAAAVGVRTIPIVTNPTHRTANVVTAKVDADLLARLVPDYGERTFYVSGPNAMVDSTKRQLQSLGVSLTHIRTDHFSGY